MTMDSPSVALLVRKGRTMMLVAKLKTGAVCLLALSLFVGGWGWVAHRSLVAEAPQLPEPAGEGKQPKQAASEEHPRNDLHSDPLPPGAVARLGTVRFRHEGMLGPFAISPDGKTLAAVSLMFGKSVAFWDISTGRLTRRLTFDHEVHYLAFTPDGKSLGVWAVWEGKGQNGILQLFDLASGKETRRFVGHLAVRFSYGGIGLEGAAFFTSDARTLVTLGGDGSVILWDVQSGKKMRQLDGGSWMVWGLSPNGKLLTASNQVSVKILRLIDVATCKEVRQLSHPADVRGAAFSPDGKTLAVAFSGVEQGIPGPGKITLWQVESGKELGTLTGHQGTVPALAFSPDGKVLASGGIDRMLCLWDVASRKELGKAQMLPTSIQQLAFSRDGKTLILSGKENHVRLWDVAAWRERVVAEGPGDAIVAIAHSPNGKLAASVSSRGGIWLWDAATGKYLRTLEYGSPPVRFSADGKSLVSGLGHSWLQVWDARSGEKQQSIPVAGGLYGNTVMTPDGKTLASCSRSTIHLSSAGGEEKLRILKLPSKEEPPQQRGKRRPRTRTQLFACRFSGDGKTLYACSKETHVLRWDVATGNSLPPIGGQDGGANGIALAPDGRSVATVTAAGALYLWETATGQPRFVTKDAGHAAPAAFSPDGRLLALANKKEGMVQLVRVADGKVIRCFAGHLGRIGCLSFFPDGRTLASGGYDSTVLLWDVTGLAAADPKKAPVLKPEELAELWAGLRRTATESYGCMTALTSSPAQAVPFLGAKLEPLVKGNVERFTPLLKKLDSDNFREREDATRELKKLGWSAELALRKAIQEKPPLETRRRLQSLLDELGRKVNVSGEQLRTLRAIEVLERIGDKQARELLRRLSEGAAGAWLTEEAKATLQRLRR